MAMPRSGKPRTWRLGHRRYGRAFDPALHRGCGGISRGAWSWTGGHWRHFHGRGHCASPNREPEPANIVSSVGRAADLLAAFPGGPIRFVIDPANLIEDVAPDSHERTIDEALDRLGPMTVLAHAKDRHADGTVAPAGDGVVDWSHFLRGLKACGVDGPLIAHGMSRSDAPGVADFLTGQVQGLVP